jgi:hypothetical protein
MSVANSSKSISQNKNSRARRLIWHLLYWYIAGFVHKRGVDNLLASAQHDIAGDYDELTA